MSTDASRDHAQGKAAWRDLLAGLGLIAGLPRFLRRRVDIDGRANVTWLLDHRAAAFLTLCRRILRARSDHPGRRLLAVAGCEYGDVDRLVRQDGVEGALLALYRAGVYLTVEEFKGRRPVVRGGTTIPVAPEALRLSGRSPALGTTTGGSRGGRTPVPLDLAAIGLRALHTGLPLALRGGAHWQTAVWGVPGGSLVTLLQYAGLPERPARWFLQVDRDAGRLAARYRWSAQLAHRVSGLVRRPLPAPSEVALSTPEPIARWMADVLRSGGTPHLDTFASAALRVVEAASAIGLELAGAQFSLAGEPTTPGRLAAIRATGAMAVPRYATSECGPIGTGCLAPRTADDLHLLTSAHAVIQPGMLRSAGPPGTGQSTIPDGALFVTSLQPTGPFAVLNLSLGDEARVVTRACGCPLGDLGWTTHLDTIRSFEKLTVGGMTFLDGDVIGVLETVLPARFGGGPTDYQLVESEEAGGRPTLRLLVHPAVGPLDSRVVAEAFLVAIAARGGAERLMALQWREAGFPLVARQPPEITPAGKILHLHHRDPVSAVHER
jgi:hypothetical protein